MTVESSRRKAVDAFWKRFMESVHRCGVTEPQDRYYFIRAREYIRSTRDCKLVEHTPERVVDFLKVIGRKNRLEDWQCRQAVFAIQILFVSTGNPNGIGQL